MMTMIFFSEAVAKLRTYVPSQTSMSPSMSQCVAYSLYCNSFGVSSHVALHVGSPTRPSVSRPAAAAAASDDDDDDDDDLLFARLTVVLAMMTTTMTTTMMFFQRAIQMFASKSPARSCYKPCVGARVRVTRC